MFDRPRQLWIGIALAVSVIAACTAAAVSDSSRGHDGPVPDVFGGTATRTRAAAQPAGLPIGLDFGDTLFAASDADVAAALSHAQTLGASWIRIDLPWDGIQPAWSTTSYDWSHFDRLVGDANKRGLRLLATLVDPPIWARAPGCRTREDCEPQDPAAYAAFAGKAAARYGPQGVHDWEIWNEENLGSFAISADPEAAYTTLLADTYRTVHQADPKALVMLGGLGMVGTDPARQRIGAHAFLSGVAADGGLASADAVGVHPYDWSALPANAPNFQLIDHGANSLEAILQQYGHGGTPFWITETGSPTSGPGPAAEGPSKTPYNHVSPQWQATLATATVRTETADPRIAGLFWYTDVDLPDVGLYFGLWTANGQVKPALAALQQAISAYRASVR
jgi:hypothetical protein